MSTKYKNILRLRNRTYGVERRMNLAKEVLKDSSPLPEPLEYKDIDEEFRRWVTEDLNISFEGKNVPTYMMVSNQRFSEYLQSWDQVDENRNLILNFKVITRENNPKAGTLVGQTRNIPGDRFYVMKRVPMVGEGGERYFVEYKVKQPFSVDLIYTINIVTNKYELLNEFNQMMNDKFKSIDCYIRPKGHFIPMKLNDISDESEYSIDNRQFYSQSYNITVMGYIMPRDSFIVEEIPALKFEIFDGVQKKSNAQIDETICDDGFNPYKYEDMKLVITVNSCDTSYKFSIDCDFKVKEVETDNIKNFSFYVNDRKVELAPDFEFNKNDEISVMNVSRYRSYDDSKIVLHGYDYTNVVQKTK